MSVIVQTQSHVWLFEKPWTAAHQASLSFTISGIWLKLKSIELVMQSNHLILYCPLLLLPSIFPSMRVFPNEEKRIFGLFVSCGHCTGASGSVLPMNIQGWFPLRLTGLISLLSQRLSRAFSSTTVWKNQFLGASLLAQMVKHSPTMQETWIWSLSWKDALEECMATHSIILAWRIPMERSLANYSPWGLKESDTTEWLSTQPSLWSSSHIRTIALTIQTFVGKVMSMLFNTLSRFVIPLLPRSKHLLPS